MRSVLTIAGRQFRSYFNGPVAYIVISIILLTLGFFFWKTFFLFGRASCREMFRWLGLILVFSLPALTMGLLAEEKRTGTIELLITMPVTEAQVILGKFLGVLGLYGVLLALTISYPLSVSTLVPVPTVTRPMFEQLCGLDERSFLYKGFWKDLVNTRGKKGSKK